MKRLFVWVLLAALPACGWTQPPPDTLWTRTFADLGERSPLAVVATADGGYVAAGQQGSQPPQGEDGFLSVFVTKVGADGGLVWDYCHAGSIEHWIYGRAMCTTPEGDLLIYAGRHTGGGSQDGQNSVIMRLSAAGELLWMREYDLRWYEFPYAIHPTRDGCYVIGCGSSTPESHQKGCVLKINADGDSLWATCYESDIYAEYITSTPDSGLMIAGRGGGGPTHIGLVRIDRHGNVLWTQPYYQHIGRPCGIAATADGNYFVAGTSYFQPFCMKVDGDGQPVWERHYYPPPGEHDLIEAMAAADDGEFLLAGFHFYDEEWTSVLHVRRVNGEGDVVWDVLRDVGQNSYCRSITAAEGEGFVTAGGVLPQGEPSLGMLQLARFGVAAQSAPSPPVPRVTALAQNYPNPFNPVTEISFALAAGGRVELAVYDVLGRRVATVLDGALAAGAHRVTWDGRGAAGGVYYCRMRAGDFVATRKMLLIR